MKYTTYLFDFDYTLADSSRGIVICFRNVLERHGHTGITDEAIKRTIGKTLEDSFSILTGITASDILAGYKKEYVKEADTHMTVNTIFFPETVGVLTELKAQGAKVGIISTKFRFRIREMLDQHFPKDFFDIIVGGEDVKHAKPDPQGIKKALRRLHRRKDETLYIGDSTVDAETAQRAKVDFVGVLNGMTTREELAAYPHRQILDNLSLLPLVERFEAYRPLRYIPPKVMGYYRLVHRMQIRGKKEEKENNAPCTCKNCGRSYEGNHCPHCGQSRNTPRFTIRNAFQNILSGFFNIDNGFSRNLLELLYRPGYMIRDYLKGKRVHYYKPFQTLFVLAALYIMAVQLIDPESMKKLKNQEKKEMTLSELAEDIRLHQNVENDDDVKFYLGISAAYTDSAKIIKQNLPQRKSNIEIEFGNEETSALKTTVSKEIKVQMKRSIKANPIKYPTDWKGMMQEMSDSLAYRDSLQLAASGGKMNRHDTLKTTIRKQLLADMMLKGNRKNNENDDGENQEFVDDLVEAGTEIKSAFSEILSPFFPEEGFFGAVSNLMKGWIHGNKAFSILALLPLLTLFTRWNFRRSPIGRKMNLTEHFFAQVYIACQILFISLLILPFTGKAHLNDVFDLSYMAIFLLFIWDYHQLFGLSWRKTTWRTIIICWYGILGILILSCIIIGTLVIFAYITQWNKGLSLNI